MFGRLSKEQLVAMTRDGVFNKNTEMPIEDLPEPVKQFLQNETSDFNHGYLSAITSLILILSEADGDLLNKGLDPQAMDRLLFRMQGISCLCALNVMNYDYPDECYNAVTNLHDDVDPPSNDKPQTVADLINK